MADDEDKDEIEDDSDSPTDCQRADDAASLAPQPPILGERDSVGALLRHRPVYRGPERTYYHADRIRASCLWKLAESGANWICITRLSESSFFGMVKADSAEDGWISLAPNGFVVPLLCPAFFIGEPRVSFRASEQVSCVE